MHLEQKSETSLTVTDLQFLCKAVHVITAFPPHSGSFAFSFYVIASLGQDWMPEIDWDRKEERMRRKRIAWTAVHRHSKVRDG